MNLAGHRDQRLSENYFEPCYKYDKTKEKRQNRQDVQTEEDHDESECFHLSLEKYSSLKIIWKCLVSFLSIYNCKEKRFTLIKRILRF